MKKAKAVEFYGSLPAVAAAAGVSRQASEAWGPVIPWRTARWLEMHSEGALQIDPKLYTESGTAKYRRKAK